MVQDKVADIVSVGFLSLRAEVFESDRLMYLVKQLWWAASWLAPYNCGIDFRPKICS